MHKYKFGMAVAVVAALALATGFGYLILNHHHSKSHPKAVTPAVTQTSPSKVLLGYTSTHMVTKVYRPYAAVCIGFTLNSKGKPVYHRGSRTGLFDCLEGFVGTAPTTPSECFLILMNLGSNQNVLAIQNKLTTLDHCTREFGKF